MHSGTNFSSVNKNSKFIKIYYGKENEGSHDPQSAEGISHKNTNVKISWDDNKEYILELWELKFY